MRKFKRRLIEFWPIRKDLLRDPVWKALSNSAKVLYIYLRSKYSYNDEHGEVGITFREAQESIGSSKTVDRAFKELREKGFIEKEKKGGLYGGVTTYKFIGQYKDFTRKG